MRVEKRFMRGPHESVLLIREGTFVAFSARNGLTVKQMEIDYHTMENASEQFDLAMVDLLARGFVSVA